MKKTVNIEGMMCKHCVKRVEDALKDLGVNATVSLENSNAIINDTAITDEQIIETITELGYEVTGIIDNDGK